MKSWTKWLLILLIGAVLYWLGSCQGEKSGRAEAAVKHAHDVLELSQRYQDSLTVLGRQEQLLRQQVQQSQRQIAQKAALAAQYDVALSHALNGLDSLQVTLRERIVLRGQIDALEQNAISLQQAVENMTAQRDLALDRGDSLQASLRETLVVAECHWNLVVAHPRCPSRTTVALASFASGVVAAVVLQH